ncbi:MAG: hypothetical protein AAFP69_19710 [Planctomycetota bacterium]
MLEIFGAHAVSFGLVIVCISLFMHFQWFWGNHKRLYPFHAVFKFCAALGIVVATFAHLYTMLALN